MKKLLWIACVVVGCGGSAATAEPESPPSGNARRETSGAEAPSDALRVEVDALGEGERQVLRYRFQPGLVEHGRARMRIDTRTVLGSEPLPAAPTPEMIMDFTLETTDQVGSAVRYRYSIDRCVVDPAGADPAMVAQIESALAPLARVTGEAVVDERGRVLDTRVHVPPDLPPELASSVQTTEDMMRQMVAPLPEEPVAVGAAWKTDTTFTASTGLRLRQRTFYRLASRQGDRVVLEMRIEQTGIPGPIAAPQPGLEILLVQLTGRAQGRSTLRLDRLMPELSEMQLEMSQDATIRAEGQTLPMHMDMQMSMHSEPR